jgi:hypothetical protein
LFFTYHQNNSGGVFDYDYDAGIARNVIIEADNAKQANAKALKVGLYWNGVDEAGDCDCCGDRWYSAWGDTEGTPNPTVYGRDAALELHQGWREEMEYEGFIHFADGRKVGFAHHTVPGLEVVDPPKPKPKPVARGRKPKAIETRKDAA